MLSEAASVVASAETELISMLAVSTVIKLFGVVIAALSGDVSTVAVPEGDVATFVTPLCNVCDGPDSVLPSFAAVASAVCVGVATAAPDVGPTAVVSTVEPDALVPSPVDAAGSVSVVVSVAVESAAVVPTIFVDVAADCAANSPAASPASGSVAVISAAASADVVLAVCMPVVGIPAVVSVSLAGAEVG